MKTKIFFLIAIVFPCCVYAQPKEAFINFDSALKYRSGLDYFIFDSTWKTVPDEVLLLTELKEIRFEYTSISDFPMQLCKLPKLERLVFKSTKNLEIASVFDCVSNSPTITSLTFDSINFQSWPKIDHSMPNIKSIYIANANMHALTSQIDSFPNIEMLSIINNPGCRVPIELSQLRKLVFFAMINCQLDSIPTPALLLTELEGLVLDNNPSMQKNIIFKQILNFRKLKSLGINNCNVDRLPSILCGLHFLQDISIDNNNLVCLPSWIKCMDSLQTISAQRNEISFLPEELWQLPSLSRVNLRSNKLKSFKVKNVKELPSPLIVFLEDNPLDQSIKDKLLNWFTYVFYDK